MSDEQRKEFEKIIRQHYTWAGSVEGHVCFKAMKAAYNAAVRKDAETADATWWLDDDDETVLTEVKKDSILQNLIP